MIINSYGQYVPSYDSCTTEKSMQEEFISWAKQLCLSQFCSDKNISYSKESTDALYNQEYNSTPKKFYSTIISSVKYYWYYGTNSSLLSQLKQQWNNLRSKMQSLKLQSFVSTVPDNVKSTTYVYNKITRTALINLANQVNAAATNAERQTLISAFNTQNNMSISLTSTATQIKTLAIKKSDNTISNIKSITRNITSAMSDLTKVTTDTVKALQTIKVNEAEIWNKSNNTIVKSFVSKGITGDIMWGVVWGKYNNDDACRKDLQKLAEDITQGSITSDEAADRVRTISGKYNLNLDSSVTAQDLINIVDSDAKYTYKKKVREIAATIVENKLNEQIEKALQERLGGANLQDWGFKTNGNIINIIREVVRGHKVAFFNEDKFIQKLTKELEYKIDKYIEERINKIIDEQTKKISISIDAGAKKITDTLDVYRKKADTLYTSLDTWTKNPNSSKLILANKLDELIKSPVDSVANLLNRIDAPLKKLGLDGFGLGDMFRQITQVYTKGWAEQIYNVTKPLVEKALGIAKQVRTAITKLIDTVNKIRDKAKQLVEKWKNTIKEAIQETTKKVVNEIVKYVKVNFMGSLSSFKL